MPTNDETLPRRHSIVLSDEAMALSIIAVASMIAADQLDVASVIRWAEIRLYAHEKFGPDVYVKAIKELMTQFDSDRLTF